MAVILKKHFRVALPSFLAVLAVLVFFFVWSKDTGEIIPLVPVRRDSFQVRVSAIGTLDAAHSQVIRSEVMGDRGKIIYLVEDGIAVKAGDILVRMDPTAFEEDVRKYTAEVGVAEALVSASDLLVEWEKTQGEKEIRMAEYAARVAELEQNRLEKGEGPLEKARLEGAMLEAKRAWEDNRNYTAELEKLAERGFSNITEITQARAKTEENEKKYEAARMQFESYRDYIFPSNLEAARAAVERTRMELEQTKKSVGLQIGKSQAGLRQARENLNSVRSSLERARQELSKTVIEAPLPGLVILMEDFRQQEKRKPRVGDTVWQNQALLYLPDISSMTVQMYIREVDLHKVSPGNRIALRVDAYPDRTYSGSVASLGLLAQQRHELPSREKYFQVTGLLDGTDERLRPGMTARVEIFSEPAVDVLVVPVAALFEHGEKTVCYVDVGASYEIREVIPGKQSVDLAEVVKGLREGERVSLARPSPQDIRRVVHLEAEPGAR